MTMNQNQNNGPQWEEVGGRSNNQRWEPTKQPFDVNNPPMLMGYFKKIMTLNGQKGPFNVAVIQIVDPNGTLGQDIDVSGGKALEDKLNNITMGSYIGIKYLGKKVSKSTGNSYNDWSVMVDKGAVPYSQLGGVAASRAVSTPPVQNNQQQFQQPVQNTQQFQQQNVQQNNNTFTPPANNNTFTPPAQNNNNNNFTPPQNNGNNNQGNTFQQNTPVAQATTFTPQNNGGQQNFGQNNGQNQPAPQFNSGTNNNAPAANQVANNNQPVNQNNQSGNGVAFGGEKVQGNPFTEGLPF